MLQLFHYYGYIENKDLRYFRNAAVFEMKNSSKSGVQ